MKNFSLFIEEGFIEYLREKHSDFLPKIYKFEFEISVCCGEFLNSSSGYEKKLSVYFRKACEFWYETRVFRIFGGEFVRWNIKSLPRSRHGRLKSGRVGFLESFRLYFLCSARFPASDGEFTAYFWFVILYFAYISLSTETDFSVTEWT